MTTMGSRANTLLAKLSQIEQEAEVKNWSHQEKEDITSRIINDWRHMEDQIHNKLVVKKALD